MMNPWVQERYTVRVNQCETTMGASVGAFFPLITMCVSFRDPEPPGDGFPEKKVRADDPQGQELILERAFGF